MQHARVFTISSGAWPRPVELDATHRPGIRWELIGFTERIVRESPQRVRHAWRSTRQPWPSGKWVISLSPAALPKSGAAVDLPLALAIHLAHRRKTTNLWAMGELHFDGRVLPVPGIPALVSIALAQGAARILLPLAAQAEVATIRKFGMWAPWMKLLPSWISGRTPKCPRPFSKGLERLNRGNSPVQPLLFGNLSKRTQNCNGPHWLPSTEDTMHSFGRTQSSHGPTGLPPFSTSIPLDWRPPRHLCEIFQRA